MIVELPTCGTAEYKDGSSLSRGDAERMQVMDSDQVAWHRCRENSG